MLVDRWHCIADSVLNGLRGGSVGILYSFPSIKPPLKMTAVYIQSLAFQGAKFACL
jgi:hypothetical protein